jgi:hypothetical protein
LFADSKELGFGFRSPRGSREAARMRRQLLAVVVVASASCSSSGSPAGVDAGADGGAAIDAAEADATPDAAGAGFSWQLAGASVLWNDPLSVSAATLRENHFAYVAQYAMNGCTNNAQPYSCATNGCNFPGNPMSGEIAPSYAELASWVLAQQQQGLYAGAWGVTYEAPEAEAHCMAEIANTLRSDHGATLDFWIVDAEKSYETHKAEGYTQRFVDTFDSTIAFSLAKAEAPECHIDIDYPYWAAHGYAIQSQAYWNAYGVNPSYCLDWVTAYGVPLEMNQVMLDGWTFGGTPAHAPGDYAADIASRNGVGFSIWRTLPAGAWSEWRPLIETLHIAEYPD